MSTYAIRVNEMYWLGPGLAPSMCLALVWRDSALEGEDPLVTLREIAASHGGELVELSWSTVADYRATGHED